MQTAVFKDETEGQLYLVERELWDDLSNEITPTTLFTAVTRNNEPFLWPVRIPSPDRPNDWHVSALKAAELAKEHWVRVTANMSGGKYDVHKATGKLPEPEWPEISFPELLRLCFEDRFIGTLDHPILKSLRGEV